MKLNNVKRTTKGKTVLDALKKTDACTDALEWIEETVKKRPKITAQGLWDACPYYYWMSWLAWTIEGLDQPGDDEGGLTIMGEIDNFASDIYNEYLDKKGFNLTNATTAATNAVHKAYESPWLR